MPPTSGQSSSLTDHEAQKSRSDVITRHIFGNYNWDSPKIFIVSLGFLSTLVPLFLRSRVSLISPYDELYHLSYIQYAYEWSVPRPGNPLNTWSREIFDCFPVHPWGKVTGNECGVPGPISSYPEGGGSTAANWPPVYYFTIAFLLRPLSLFFSSPLFAARFAGVVIWSLGTQCLITQTSRIFIKQNKNVFQQQPNFGNWKIRLAISMLFGVLPLAYQHASFVSPYAFAPLAAAIALAAIRANQRHSTLAVTSGAIALMLPHALPIILASALTSMTLGQHSLPRSHADRQTISIFRTVGQYSRQLVFCAAFFIAYRVWTFIQFSIRSSVWDENINQNAMTQYDKLSFNIATAQSRFWSFVPEGFWTHQFQDQLEHFYSYSWGLVALICLGVSLSSSPLNKRFGTLILIFSIGYSIFLASQLDFNIPSRYGLVVLVTWITFALVQVGSRIQTVIFLAAVATYIQLFSHYPLSV